MKTNYKELMEEVNNLKVVIKKSETQNEELNLKLYNEKKRKGVVQV